MQSSKLNHIVYPLGLRPTGIYMAGCKHYIVARNNIGGNVTESKGIMIRASDTTGASLVYRNTLDSLQYGTWAYENNDDELIRCNDYLATRRGFIVTSASGRIGTVDLLQGIPCDKANEWRAGNTFDTTCLITDIITDNSARPFEYNHYDLPVPHHPGCNPIGVAAIDNCGDQLLSTSGHCDPAQFVKQPITGNGTGINLDFNYTLLDAISLYTSDVLLYQDSIDDYGDSLGIYKANIHELLFTQQLHLHYYVKHNLIDTDVSLNELIGDIESAYESAIDLNKDVFIKQLLPLYMQNEDYTNAENTLDDLPTGGLENDNYIDLTQLEIDVKKDTTKSYDNLNDTEKDILDAVADSDSRAAIKAQLLLKLYYGVPYEKLFPSIEESSSKRSGEKQANSNFIVYPNPTNQLVNLNYPENRYQKLKIFNAQGTLVLQLNVNANGSDVVSLQQLVSGIYYIKLLGLEEEDINKKLIIVK